MRRPLPFRVLFLALALVLAGCNSRPAPEARFDPSEAAFMEKTGKTTIVGQAFLRDQTGHTNVRYAAGEIVRLIPATSYAKARLDYYFHGAKFAPAASIPKNDPDPDYVAHMRTTKAGPMGRFAFQNVPPGDYFLSTQLIWRPDGDLLSQGGLMYEAVTVTGAEAKPLEVVISGN
jgi:hypothetical protein